MHFLAIFGNLYLRGTVRPSALSLRSQLLVAVKDRLYSNNAEDAERIRAIILFDDVSDDDSIDEATESDENYVELTESISECAEHCTSDDYSCTEVDATDNCCH